MRNRTWMVVGLWALSGCTAQIGSERELLGHEQHEMTATADELRGWRSEGGWLVSPRLDAPEGASRVGVLVNLLEGEALPPMEARLLENGVPVTDWTPVDATWGEVDHHVGVAELGRLGDAAELRVAAAEASQLEQLRWSAVIPAPEEEAILADEEAFSAGREALRSELRSIGVVSREAWGARATRCTSPNATKTKMAIHYTVTPSSDPARQVRGIQRYHMDSRGWCDVGYHFLVGVDGSIYEGRPLHLLGAHVGGHNTNNIGISFIGCFNSYGCNAGWGPKHPPEAMIQAGGRLLGELSRLYGITLDSSRVQGHRDHPGQSTSCPGDYLRPRIGDMLAIGRSGSSGPPPAAPPSSGGSCGHSYGGTYGDRACSAGYQCCDGRWRTRDGGCGACACVEETGTSGCTGAAAPTPTPSGASCAHSYGGTYRDRACSASYQCCDGAWRTRAGGCGTCSCVEETGTSGC